MTRCTRPSVKTRPRLTPLGGGSVCDGGRHRHSDRGRSGNQPTERAEIAATGLPRASRRRFFGGKVLGNLRQPLLLAVCFGLRLDCLQAALVRTALRATIGPIPDATPRALTAGLFFSRSFFNRLDGHFHSRPPRFTSPIVPLMGSRINPVCYGSGEVLTTQQRQWCDQ